MSVIIVFIFMFYNFLIQQIRKSTKGKIRTTFHKNVHQQKENEENHEKQQ